jgi:predicted  nucleic acid-binding Zn-ribbon protein
VTRVRQCSEAAATAEADLRQAQRGEQRASRRAEALQKATDLATDRLAALQDELRRLKQHDCRVGRVVWGRGC